MRYDVRFAEAVGSSPRAHVRDTNVFDAAQDVVMDVNEGPIRSSTQGSTTSRLHPANPGIQRLERDVAAVR